MITKKNIDKVQGIHSKECAISDHVGSSIKWGADFLVHFLIKLSVLNHSLHRVVVTSVGENRIGVYGQETSPFVV